MLKYYWQRFQQLRLLRKGRRLSAKMAPALAQTECPFFIVSCGRSGTTLLRKMLMRGGEVHIPPESDDLLPIVIQYYISNQGLPWPKLVEGCLKLYQDAACFVYWDIDLKEEMDNLLKLSASEQSLHRIIAYIYDSHRKKFNPNATRIGDKTPYLVLRLDWVRLLYPQAPIVHLLRDGRAVVASRMQAFGESMEQAANRWIWSLNAVEKLKKQKNVRFLEFRYEDLVAAPAQTLTTLCDFLQLQFSGAMLSDKKVSMGDDVLAHHANTKNDTIIKGDDKWKSAFSDQKLKELKLKIDPFMKKTGYEW